jgi:type IV pilus assembly protein PilE
MNIPGRRAGMRGITLIEMIIVVTILGILAAIVYPSYIDRTRRAKRTDAKAALINIAGQQERFFLKNNRFATTLEELGVETTQNEFYTLSLLAPSASEFMATAIPIGSAFDGEGQWGDRECLNWSIDHTGRKIALGQGGVDNSVACWR